MLGYAASLAAIGHLGVAPWRDAHAVVGLAFDKAVDEVGGVEVEHAPVGGEVDAFGRGDAQGGVALQLVDVAAGMEGHQRDDGVGGEHPHRCLRPCLRYACCGAKDKAQNDKYFDKVTGHLNLKL